MKHGAMHFLLVLSQICGLGFGFFTKHVRSQDYVDVSNSPAKEVPKESLVPEISWFEYDKRLCRWVADCWRA